MVQIAAIGELSFQDPDNLDKFEIEVIQRTNLIKIKDKFFISLKFNLLTKVSVLKVKD